MNDRGFLTSFHRKPWVRALALFSAVWLTGCYTNQAVRLGPNPQPMPVTVTVTSGRSLTVFDARQAVGDTVVVGNLGTNLAEDAPQGDVLIPIREILVIEQRRRSSWRTNLAVVLVVLGTVGVVGVLTAGSGFE